MIHLRIYWKRSGGHIDTRWFSGKTGDTTHGKNGDLIFDEREWDEVKALLEAGGVEVIFDGDIPF